VDKIPTEILNSIKKLVEELNNNDFNILNTYLFGSYANNSANYLSDIDIALISKSFSGNRYLDKDKIRKFVVNINSDISPIPFTPEDFNENNIMAKEILSTGIKLDL